MSTASPERDRDLIRIEKQIRQAIRDAVNRNSRKPFYWGGLAGYHQLKAIALALDQIIPPGEGSAYLRRLTQPVERVLEKNRTLADELQQAHQWLERIAHCLRYPSSSCTKGKSEHISQAAGVVKVSSFQVAKDMEALLQEFHPNAWRQPVQARLLDALQKRWRSYGQELLYCYDIPGLPPDNLQMESLFGRLRRNHDASVGVNPRGSYVNLVRSRCCLTWRAKRYYSNKSRMSRWRIIGLSVFGWQRRKSHANSFVDCTVTLRRQFKP